MKTLTEMLPWAALLGVAGAAIWFLYERDIAAGRWLFAGLLGAHGLVHLLYLVPQPAASTADAATWPFDLTRPWLATSAGLNTDVMRMIGIVLVAIVVVGFALSGLSALGILVSTSWWPGLVTVSSTLSLLLMALFFASGLLVGVTLDAVLIWLALATSWMPSPA